MAAWIDDKDSDCEDDDLQVESGGVTYPLRADRWWYTPGVLDQGKKMSLGGVWGSSATFGFVQGAA